MSEPATSQHPSFVSRAEHEAAILAHKVALHRVAIVFLVAAAVLAWFGYAAVRDFQEYKAVRAAEKIVSAATKAPAPAPAVPVPITINIPRQGFLGRSGGSGRDFIPRQKPSTAKPTTSRDAKSGDLTTVDCQSPTPPTVTRSVDGKGIVTTIYTCPPPPPNVTRLDPAVAKDGALWEARYGVSLKKVDSLGEIHVPRTRTKISYGLFVNKDGGLVEPKQHEDPRPAIERGRFLEVYAAGFRRYVPSSAPGAKPPAYGGALGLDWDAFRVKDFHFRPYVEVSAPATEVRYGVKVPWCIGAVCP